MRENLKIKVEAPQYTVVAGVTFAQVDAWFDHTRRDLKMDACTCVFICINVSLDFSVDLRRRMDSA